jgi:hypothetical protein
MVVMINTSSPVKDAASLAIALSFDICPSTGLIFDYYTAPRPLSASLHYFVRRKQAARAPQNRPLSYTFVHPVPEKPRKDKGIGRFRLFGMFLSN